MIKKSLIIIWNEIWLALFNAPIYHPRFWEDERLKSRYINNYGFLKKLKTMLSGFNSDKYVLYDFRNNSKKYYLNDIRRRILSERISKRHYYIVHNKIVFNKYLENICNIIPKIALLKKGSIMTIQGDGTINTIDDIIILLNYEAGLFLKPYDGGSGRDIYKVEKTNKENIYRVNEKNLTKKELRELLLSLDGYILEKKFTQKGISNTFYPKTLNTLRIYTMIDPVTDKASIACAVHRIGTSKSIFADNWSQGGLSVWIEPETGVMGSGIQYPFDGVLKHHQNHPDSGARLEGRQIPNWEYIKAEVLKCADYLYFMPWLGWDVVLSGDKVYILEANYNPDLNLIQVHKPLLESEKIRNFYMYHGVISDEK